MSKELTVKSDATLSKARRGPADWLSYIWTIEKVPELKSFIEHQTGVEIVPGDMDFCVQKENGKEIVKPYPRSTYLNKIAHHLGISRKVELVDKIIGNKGKMAIVKVTAILGERFEEELGVCDSTEPGRGNMPFSAILGMAITRASNRAYRRFVGLSTSTEEMPEDLLQHKRDLAQDGEVPTKCPSCGEHGWSRLQKRCLLCFKTYEEIVEEQKQ